MHAGTKIGPYAITVSIGAGGMGEVFRARDTRLNRDVAIKVLPKDFVSDADRLRRFEQEAKTLAALNHPNVLTIHDAGVHEGAPYLVSELLEGKTLREEMNGSALSLRKATEFALQIAHGLAAAHGKGVIHRDLKPENIFITKDGRVKILDFGLAKLRQAGRGVTAPRDAGEAQHGSLGTASPTIRIDADAVINTTEPGMVLGTPAYMSPEQVRGEAADHRADIFAFGAVLYEMLSGTRPFRRDTPVASMNAVLSEEPPPLSASNAKIPPALERIVHRCLEKQQDSRFQSAKDLAFAIESVGAASTSAHAAQHGKRARLFRVLPWAAVALIVLVAFGAFFAGRRAASNSVKQSAGASSPAPLRRIEIRVPLPNQKARTVEMRFLAISPDGRKLAYVNGDGLWLRRLDDSSAPALIAPGEDVGSPFWSPNSTALAWFEKSSLKRAPVAGGRPASICQLPEDLRFDLMEGGAWLDDDAIIFTTGHTGLHRVSANGGNPILVLPLGEGESAFCQASAVPGGRGVLFVVRRIIRQAEGDAFPNDTLAFWNPKNPVKSKRVLFQRLGSNLGFPVYSSSGHVVFSETIRLDRDSEPDRSLWAMPVSSETLEPAGEPFRLNDSSRRLSISADGTLAILQATTFGPLLAPRQLVWVDRSGKVSAPFGPVQKGLTTPRLSPDERLVAFAAGPSLERFQIWIHDLVSGGSFPLRPEGKSEQMPAWMPSGREIAVIVDGAKTIIRPIEGTGATKTVGSGNLMHLSRSGQYAFLMRRPPPTPTNSYVRLAGEQPERIPLPGGSLNLLNARRLRPNLSPDDTTLAFESGDSGRTEIWAVAFPGFTNRVQVSRDGGISPQWSRDGKELFFLSEDARSMMVAPVTNQNGRQFGPPTKVFDLPVSIYPGDGFRRHNVFDVSADGQRFLMMYSLPDANASTSEFGTPVLLIENWFEEYREKK